MLEMFGSVLQWFDICGMYPCDSAWQGVTAHFFALMEKTQATPVTAGQLLPILKLGRAPGAGPLLLCVAGTRHPELAARVEAVPAHFQEMMVPVFSAGS